MRYWYTNLENPAVSFEENSATNGGPMEYYPGNIWTGNNENWAIRVGAVEKTKEEAQDIVNTALEGVVWGEYADVSLVGKPVVIILP